MVPFFSHILLTSFPTPGDSKALLIVKTIRHTLAQTRQLKSISLPSTYHHIRGSYR